MNEEDNFDTRGQLDQDITDYLAGGIDYGSKRWLSLFAAGCAEIISWSMVTKDRS